MSRCFAAIVSAVTRRRGCVSFSIIPEFHFGIHDGQMWSCIEDKPHCGGWRNAIFGGMDVLKKLFEQRFHVPPDRVQPLQGQLGGSGRNIIRLANAKNSAIGILYPVKEENIAFLEFSKHFRKYGLPVPEIYAEALAE